MKAYNPKFNLRHKETGKIKDLTDTTFINWDETKYEIVLRRKTWSNQLSERMKSI